MTYLVKIQNNKPSGAPISDEEFKKIYNNVSFPDILSNETVEQFGYNLFEFSAQPSVTNKQKVIEIAPINNNGIWMQTWEIRELNSEELSQKHAIVGDAVKTQRNAILSGCDWTQLPDSPVNKEAWATYRQQLRDITLQTGYPFDIIWPTKPE